MAESKTPTVTAAKASALWLARLCAVLLPTMVTAPSNGLPASSLRFPFLAGLIDQTEPINYIPFCTGTILTANFVLTTYGCLRRDEYGGGSYRRKPRIQAPSLIVIYGTSYSPTFTKQSDRLYPNWQLYPEETTPSRGAETHELKYDARQAKSFIFPDETDLAEAYNGYENKDEILKAGNEYVMVDKYGKRYTRYRIDFAVIELKREIKWSDEAVPAIYTLESARLSHLWWEKKVGEAKSGIEFMDSCFLVGWGGWSGEEGTQVRLRYTEVKYVPYSNCEISYCTECSYCNKTWRVDWQQQACYKSVLNADACAEDEGAPVWCPWAGVTTTRSGRPFQTGGVVGILSYATSCRAKSVPSIYSNTWRAYSLISRAVKYSFPPTIVVYEDILEDPPEAHRDEVQNDEI